MKRIKHLSPGMKVQALLFSGLLGFAAAVATLMGGQSAWAQTAKPRIAVVTFQGETVEEAERRAVTNRLRDDLVNMGVFTILDRDQTDTVMDELAFQQVGLTDPREAARLGRMLNVEHIVSGRIIRLPRAYQVNVKMIRVETSEIERSESLIYHGNFMGLLENDLTQLAERLARMNAPPEDPSQTELIAAKAPPETPGVQRPVWPLLSAVALAGGAIWMNEQSKSSHERAGEMAADSREKNDPELFEKSRKLQKKSDAQKKQANILAGLAGAVLIYYAFSDAPAQESTPSANMYIHAPTFALLPAPGGIKARIALRW